MRAFASEPFGQGENAVVVARAHHVAEGFQAGGGIHLLGDYDGLRIGFERHGTEGAGGDRLLRHCACGWRSALDGIGNGAQMLGRGAATAANYLHAVLDDKPPQIGGQFGGREPVDRAAALVLRQAGVGQHADGQGGILAEEANRVVHLRGAGGAVEANHVGLKAFKDGEGRADLRAEEHGAGGFESNLGLERNVAAGGRDAAFARVTNRVLAGCESDLDLQ